MAYNSISIKPYTKSHLELQREITLIELAHSPYFFAQRICLAYINMFARFDENPAMTLQDIKETKRYGRTDARTHGQTENVKTVYPTTNKVCGGYNNHMTASRKLKKLTKSYFLSEMNARPEGTLITVCKLK